MKTEITKNDLVIQGVLKEAYFSDSVFVIEGSECYIRIIDIIENKIRDSSANKKIYFKKISGHYELKERDQYTLTSRFHRYTIKGSFKFEEQKDDRLIFSIPSQLSLENQRKDDRVRIAQSLQEPIPIMLRTHSLHREGVFVLEDSSQDGYGGTVTVAQGFPIEIDTRVVGKMGAGTEFGELNGIIVSATLIDPVKPDFDTYRVGISQSYQSELIPHDGKDRRKQKRHKVSLQLTLQSKMHPDHTLVLDVDDVSVSGFSGVSEIGSIVSSVPIGATFNIKDEKTLVRLVRFRGNRYHFQIIFRTSEDSVQWLKRMSPYMYPGVKCASKDIRDLYRIFLQAGAVSTKYLKRHQMFDELLVNQKHDYVKNDSSVHRWFVQGDTKSTEFYISAIRSSSSCWVLGDIAKISESNIDGKEIIRSFFESFSDFASSSSDVGTLMIFWIDQHPLWVGWHEKIKNSSQELLNSEVNMNYFRLDGELKSVNDSIKISNIEKRDYKLRREVIESLPLSSRKFLEHAFDFNESGAHEILSVDGKQLVSRKYFKVSGLKGEFFGSVNLNQDGSSINRFLDSIFLFPIGYDLKRLESELPAISDTICAHFNIVAPSIRVVHDQNVDIGTKMSCLLLYPEAFRLF